MGSVVGETGLGQEAESRVLSRAEEVEKDGSMIDSAKGCAWSLASAASLQEEAPSTENKSTSELEYRSEFGSSPASTVR